jgi:hypothetical protein
MPDANLRLEGEPPEIVARLAGQRGLTQKAIVTKSGFTAMAMVAQKPQLLTYWVSVSNDDASCANTSSVHRFEIRSNYGREPR